MLVLVVVYGVFQCSVGRLMLLLDSIRFMCRLVKCCGCVSIVVSMVVDDGLIICLRIFYSKCIVVIVVVLLIMIILVLVVCSSLKLGVLIRVCRLLQIVFGVNGFWCLLVVNECVVLLVLVGLVSISWVCGLVSCRVWVVLLVRLLLFIGIISMLNGLLLCSSFSVVVFCLVMMVGLVQGWIRVVLVLVCILVQVVLWLVIVGGQCQSVVLWWVMLVSLVVMVFLGIIMWQGMLWVCVVEVRVVLWLLEEWVIMLVLV